MEALKYRLHRGRRSNLHFYRDSNGIEVDLLLNYDIGYKLTTDYTENEIKALKELANEHRAQVYNILKATGLKLVFLVNFGHYPKAQIERIVLLPFPCGPCIPWLISYGVGPCPLCRVTPASTLKPTEITMFLREQWWVVLLKNNPR